MENVILFRKFAKYIVMKKIVILCFMVIGILTAKAQESAKPFVANGEPYVRVFSNFHGDFTDNDPEYKFELQRAYLGHKAYLSETFSTNVCIDVATINLGGSKDYRIIFKYAALAYKKGKLDAAIGLIGLNHVREQEKHWGHRYLYKSVMDQEKWTHTADLGASIEYTFNDYIQVDATVRNGEGYKSVQADNTLRAGAGLTATLPSGLVARLYYDVYDKNEMQSMYTIFLGYSLKKKLKLGVEFDYGTNYGWMKNHEVSAFSAFSSYTISKTIEIFGRYDLLGSNVLENETDPWNQGSDGQVVIAGIQYNPVKGVKLALNHQGRLGATPNEDYTNKIYLNLEYRFN